MKNIEPSAIKSVGFYVASPVECCDKCGQGIKYVYPVSFKDGSVRKYGSECINKVMSGDTSLQTLWRKNAKRLAQLKHWQEVLQRPELPIGFEYFNSGLFFVADDTGRNIAQERGGNIWHPYVDVERNAKSRYAQDGRKEQATFVAGAWRANTLENFKLESAEQITEALKFYAKEIARIEPFLGRILAKGLVTDQSKL